MLDRDVRSVPVLDDGHVIGIISRRDLLRSVLRTDDVLAHEVQERLDAYTDEPRRWIATVTDGVVRIDGLIDDDAERRVVELLARTVPGVAAVTLKSTARRSAVSAAASPSYGATASRSAAGMSRQPLI
jgi:CBS domain-containing protein